MEKAPEVSGRCPRLDVRTHDGPAGPEPGEPAGGEQEEQERHGLKTFVNS